MGIPPDNNSLGTQNLNATTAQLVPSFSVSYTWLVFHSTYHHNHHLRLIRATLVSDTSVTTNTTTSSTAALPLQYHSTLNTIPPLRPSSTCSSWLATTLLQPAKHSLSTMNPIDVRPPSANCFSSVGTSLVPSPAVLTSWPPWNLLNYPLDALQPTP
jgi:hypothetical protein